MKRSTRITLLVVILIIASFLRLYHLTSTPPGLYPDEAADGNNAVEAAETGHFQSFYVEDNGREGLYINIVALFLKAWPVYEPWVLRLPAAIAGILTVFALYLLAAELFGESVGLLAAFLLATSFWHINFSRIGFRAILAPLFLALALYFFIRSIRREKPRDGIACAIAGGMAYGLGFYTYIAFRATPILFLLFIPFFRKKPHFWKRTGFFLLATAVIAAPLGWYFMTHPADFFGRTAQVSITRSAHPAADLARNVWQTVLMLNVRGDGNWRHNISGEPELFPLVGVLLVVGVALGTIMLARMARGKRDGETFPLVLTFSWTVVGLLPEAASNEGIPHSLRAILMLPPIMILAAYGGVRLFETLARDAKDSALVGGMVRCLAVFFLIAVLAGGAVDYFIVWARDPNVPGAFNADYVDVARAMNALPAKTPKYVVVQANGVLARGIPVPAQTVMFLTHSFTAADAAARNIRYLLPEERGFVPRGTPTGQIFFIR